MKRKLVSILTALALCLSLLPGTAWAVGETGVKIGNVTLESGKQYVADTYDVKVKTDETADIPYLDYNNGVLTVHGRMVLTSYFTITGNVTFTGGEGSCLETGTTFLNSGTLTLSGSVDFKPQSLSGNYVSSVVNKLTTTADYSGDIAIQNNSATVLWDVKSSASISIGGNVSYSSSNTPAAPMTLKSAGDISTGLLQYHTITIEGKNVSIMNSPVFTGKSLTIKAAENVTVPNCVLLFLSGNSTEAVSVDISAGGNVEITSSAVLMYDPPNGRNDRLTIRDAKSVSIQGITNSNNPSLFRAPVTFENCGSVTVTATGTGEILKEGVAVTSDCPWTATTGGKTVTMPSGRLTYGGNITSTLNSTSNAYIINSTDPIVYDAGDGKVFYEPVTASGTAVLTLDGASFDDMIYIQPSQTRATDSSLQLELKNNNRMKITANASLTLTGSGSFAGELMVGGFTKNSTGTLNAVVGVLRESDSRYGYTVYGERSTSDSAFNVSTSVPLTIAEGAVLTVDKADRFTINGLEGLTNNGTIINNSVITINADTTTNDAAISAFIKGLNLSGTGNVSVKKGSATDTYTNSGVKFLTPAGTLNLSSAGTNDTSNWDTQGYKWTDVQKDTDGNITSATLTLAPGFNATSVTLPDAAVTIETTGESRIGTLTPGGGSGPQKTALTFSGTGPLTVNERINFAGGDGNTITVNENATVIANGGIYIGASGGVNSTITVNGTLTAKADSGTVISAGSVAIGGTGFLKVSGESGVLLNGMPKNTGATFNNVFTIADGGCFTANCSDYNLRAYTTSPTEFPVNTGDAFVIPKDFLPENCEPKLNEDNIDLWNTKENKVYSGPLTIHKYHTWSSDWTADGDNGHYHACTFEGCTAKNDERPHYYAHGADACRDCGHTRPAGTPDSDSGGSSGGSGSSSYAVTVEKASHGEVTSDRRTASQGDTVTLTVTPDNGYGLSALTVTDSRGNAIALTHEGGGTYRFTMPGRAVTVHAAFASSACTGGADCPSRAFSDLDTGKWYHEAVDYVLKNGLMSGYGSGLFGPDDNLTRAQFTQILHNKEGRPVVNYLLQYSDVADGAWYTEAIRWATSQGVVNGYGNGRFGPNDNITREQLAVMLWRYAGSPAAAGEALHFTDADQAGGYALDALRWAVEKGILNGKGGGILDPKGLATRAQATQMLKNFLKDA